MMMDQGHAAKAGLLHTIFKRVSSIKVKLLLAMVAFLILTTGIGSLWLRQVSSLNENAISIADSAVPKIAVAIEIEAALKSHLFLVARRTQTTGFRQLAEIEASLQQEKDAFEQRLAGLGEVFATQSEAQLLSGAQDLWARYLSTVEVLLEHTNQGRLRDAELLLNGNTRALAVELFDVLDTLAVSARNEVLAVSRKFESEMQSARTITVSAILVGILATFASLVWITTSVSNPVLRISDAMRRLTAGVDDTPIPKLTHRRDEIGVLAQAATSFRDTINASRKLAGDLEVERARLEATVHNMPLALCIFDVSGAVTKSNTAFRDVFLLPEGFAPANQSQKTVLEVIGSQARIPPKDQLVKEMLAAVERRQRASFTWELVSDRCVEVIVQPTEDGWMLIGSDVTEREMARRHARQAERLSTIGKLTGGVAHDFNNLLAVIVGNMELLRDVHQDDETLRMIDTTIDAATRGSNLTKSMLSFAQKARLDPKVIDLKSLLNRTAVMVERTLPSSIRLNIDFDGDNHFIRADQTATEDTLLNLILNAKDAMPDGGRIDISVAMKTLGDHDANVLGLRAEQYVRVSVSDTGIGIEEQHLPRVFDPFFTTKGPGGGSGLGLSRIQGFMEQSDGKAVARSRPGQGATFELWFPVSDVSAPADSPAEQPRKLSGGLKGKRILFAEDADEVRDVITRMLRKAGCDVVECGDAHGAMRTFGEDPNFDLVLADVMMPGGMLGTDLAGELWQTAPDLPVVFLTGYADESLIHLQQFQDSTKLVKPVLESELLDTLSRKLGMVE